MTIENNWALLKRISPNKTVIVAFLAWLLIFISSPLKVNIDINWEAYLFVIFSFLSFFGGGWIYKIRQKKTITIRETIGIKKIKNQYKLYNIITTIATLGLSLKIIDRFLYRGIAFNADFETNRAIMEASSGNIIGIIASFTTPFCYFPLYYYYKYKFPKSYTRTVTVYLLFVGQIFDSIFLSTRSSIFVNITILVLYLLYFKKIHFNISTIIKYLPALFIIIALMSYIFLQRTKVYAGDDVYNSLLYNANINFCISSKGEFLSYFAQSSEYIKIILITYLSITQYFTHGMFEFSYTYDKFNFLDHSYGQYTFLTYYRLLSTLFGKAIDIKSILYLSPRVGVYTTFLGPLFIDFGWLNLLFMAIAGFLINKVYYNALFGRDWAVIMYFYFFITLAFWPVFNFINGAGGIFILTSTIILYYITHSKYETR